MSNQEWRVLDGEGREQGPYSLQDLQNYFTTGNITRETLVWTEGFPEWYPAGQIEGLLPPAAAVAPAPLPQPAAPEQMPTAPVRQGAPAWLSFTTLGIGVAALVFFFFPWVSCSLNLNPETNQKMSEVAVQTGFQSITAKADTSDEFVFGSSKKLVPLPDGDEEEAAKETGKDGEKNGKEEAAKEKREDLEKDGEEKWGLSVLVLIAMIAIGIAIVAVLVGLLNKLASLVIVAQSLLAAAAVLIGTQMALQFPMVKSFVESQNKQKEELKTAMKKRAETIKEIESDSAEEQRELRENLKTMQQMQKSNLFATSYEPSCFVTVGLLSLSIFLVVVTMSSSNSTPLIMPQGNYQSAQPPQSGQAPQQPGAGLKFH